MFLLCQTINCQDSIDIFSYSLFLTVSMWCTFVFTLHENQSFTYLNRRSRSQIKSTDFTFLTLNIYCLLNNWLHSKIISVNKNRKLLLKFVNVSILRDYLSGGFFVFVYEFCFYFSKCRKC